MATYLHLRQQQLIYLLHPTYLACSLAATIVYLPHPTHLAYYSCANNSLPATYIPPYSYLPHRTYQVLQQQQLKIYLSHRAYLLSTATTTIYLPAGRIHARALCGIRLHEES